MTQLIFATHNEHKTDELRSILPHVEILSLKDIGYQPEIPETGESLYANALLKVRAIYRDTGQACLADDTGLAVEVLHGEPGVYSARYAGPNASADENIDKLLYQLRGQGNRKAKFTTVMAYMNDQGQYRMFEGSVAGHILEERRGGSGFGYDPVFRAEGHDRSFAEMAAADKNAISHRARALDDFQVFFKTSGTLEQV